MCLFRYAVTVLTYRIGEYLQLTTRCNGGFTSVNGEIVSILYIPSHGLIIIIIPGFPSIQFAIVFLRDLPYLIVSGLIVIWYLYQVIVGTIKCVQGTGDDVSSYVKVWFLT